MLIGISLRDREELQTHVNLAGVQFAIQNIEQALIPSLFHRNVLIPFNTVSGNRLYQPVPFGNCFDQVIPPWQFIEFNISSPYLLGSLIAKMEHTIFGNFNVTMYDNYLDPFYQSQVIAEFDPYLNLTGLQIIFSLHATPAEYDMIKRRLMRDLYNELPTVAGYLLASAGRGRVSVLLDEPREYQARGSHYPSTQTMGDIKEILNRRDNPTGIGKRPHERAGHQRKLASGKIVHVGSTIVHPDDYEPSADEKKLKY